MTEENEGGRPPSPRRTNPTDEEPSPHTVAKSALSPEAREPSLRDSVLDEAVEPQLSATQSSEKQPEKPQEWSFDDVPAPRTPPKDTPARVHTSISIKTSNSPPASSPKEAGPTSPSNQQSLNVSEQTPTCPFQEAATCPFQQAPPNPQQQMPDQQEAEEETDPFSDYSDETASLTESINSLNYQYQDENGRRYHGFGDSVAYLLPNDEREQERLEGQHHTWCMILGGNGLHLAPLKPNIQNVLDVATGTGVWAMDFADEYPSAKVVGTDLSPIQPNFVPPNCSFIVEDSEAEWMWDESFDYIHSRTLASAWRDWLGYFHKCYEHLKPGGYIELHEFTFPFHCDDGTAPRDNPMMHWSHLFNEGCAKGGVDLLQCANLDPLLREAGFVDIVKVHKRLMFNGWSDDPDEKRRGIFYGSIFDWGVSMALLTRRLGWSREEAEVFLIDVRKAAADESVHVYIPLYLYYARKPESTVL